MTVGQIEAFETPPTRRLIVRPGHTAWWGVDPSTKHIAIAQYAYGMIDSAIRPIPQYDLAQRAAAIRKETLTLAATFEAVPGVIVIEQPSGTHTNLQLAYAVGAVLCALGEYHPQAVVETVTSGEWKRDVCGHGGIKKPKPTSSEPYPVLTWARAQGYEGSSWDEADARAICEYARRTFALDAR